MGSALQLWLGCWGDVGPEGSVFRDEAMCEDFLVLPVLLTLAFDLPLASLFVPLNRLLCNPALPGSSHFLGPSQPPFISHQPDSCFRTDAPLCVSNACVVCAEHDCVIYLLQNVTANRVMLSGELQGPASRV